MQEQEGWEEFERQLQKDHAFKPAMDSARKEQAKERRGGELQVEDQGDLPHELHQAGGGYYCPEAL